MPVNRSMRIWRMKRLIRMVRNQNQILYKMSMLVHSDFPLHLAEVVKVHGVVRTLEAVSSRMFHETAWAMISIYCQIFRKPRTTLTPNCTTKRTSMVVRIGAKAQEIGRIKLVIMTNSMRTMYTTWKHTKTESQVHHSSSLK